MNLWFFLLLGDPVMIDRVALKVNDKIITERELLTTYRQRKRALLQDKGQELDEAALAALWTEVVDEATDQLLLFEKAFESGAAISEDALESRLQSLKEANGFNEEEFAKALLEQTGMTPQEYVDFSRRDESARRVIYSQVLSRIEIEDSEIAKYYETHAESFQVPARYRLSEVVALKGEDPALARFKIASCQNQLENGASFEEVASSQSDAGSREFGGDLGEMEYGDLHAVIESAVKELSPGAVSQILETESAYFLIKVSEKIPARRKKIDEVKEEIRMVLQEPRLQSKLDEFLAELRKTYLVDRLITTPSGGL
jgi:parvulin-like peptidyl-prolyl isomerase